MRNYITPLSAIFLLSMVGCDLIQKEEDDDVFSDEGVAPEPDRPAQEQKKAPIGFKKKPGLSIELDDEDEDDERAEEPEPAKDEKDE